MASRCLGLFGTFGNQCAEGRHISDDPHAHRFLQRAGLASRPTDFTAAAPRIAGGEGTDVCNISHTWSGYFRSKRRTPDYPWRRTPRFSRRRVPGAASEGTDLDSQRHSIYVLSPFRLLDNAVTSLSFQVLACSMTALHYRSTLARTLRARDHAITRGKDLSMPRTVLAAASRPTDGREQEARPVQQTRPDAQQPSRAAPPSRRSGALETHRGRRPG